MNATEKYLHGMRALWLRDSDELSDSDLDALLGTEGDPSDPSKHNPNPLTAAGLAELLGAVASRKRREAAVLCGLLDLDVAEVMADYDAIEDFGDSDPASALLEVLERELGRRGPVSRGLTAWLVRNAFDFADTQEANGWTREQLGDAIAKHLEPTRLEYARAVWVYFNPKWDDRHVELCLLASCILLGLDVEAVREKAAILEFDAGMNRAAATMRAVSYAIRDRCADFWEPLSGAFFDLAQRAYDLELENGWLRARTIEWIAEQLLGDSRFVLKFPSRRAV